MADKKEVFAKCKRGSDMVTKGQSCDSLQAVIVSPPRSHTTTMQCVKCKHTWSVPVGGSFSL
jgi:hypothetical protein